ncbi:hypothetical protein [Pedobacter sp. B4-66]|uniref:hypothetical protein n=1 Tax=Pedobacter sp. B4-66 TaxID=2817280 RepID=UPI001BDAD6DB|nr:hypothetical protein [Pedobacter sp. B4-66]
MNVQFNFQINPDHDRKHWDAIRPHKKLMSDRVSAVMLAKKVARLFKAEVRLTEGDYPFTTSGSYFNNKEQ